MKAVLVSEIDGTKLRRAPLDVAVSRMFRNARRIAKNLERWLRANPDTDMDGLRQWMADYEQRFVFAALREQRERAKLTAETGASPMTEVEFEAKLAELARKAVLAMPADELEQLLKQRAIDVKEEK